MNDLISRQTAYDTLTEYYHHKTEIQHQSLKEALSRVPPIDAVPVVRCKDCKWWREETDHTCRKWGGASPRNANGYCDDGERKEE